MKNKIASVLLGTIVIAVVLVSGCVSSNNYKEIGAECREKYSPENYGAISDFCLEETCSGLNLEFALAYSYDSTVDCENEDGSVLEVSFRDSEIKECQIISEYFDKYNECSVVR